MQCAKPIWIVIKTPVYDPRTGGLSNKMEVPCGRCMPCRIRRRSEWAVRLHHELGYYDSAAFVTLTYSDEKLPVNASLVKRDLQLFHKRLRKSLVKSIKYYAVGEYGSTTDRPHYHGIYFGLSLSQADIVKDCWLPDCRVHVGSVTYDSIQYVTGYIEDKLLGEKAITEYTDKGREPPFSLMSRGLGLRFCLDNQDQILSRGVTVYGKNMGIPRYYQRKLGITSIEYMSDIKDHIQKVKDYYGGTPIENYDSVAASRLQNGLNKEAQIKLRDLRKKDKFSY